MLKPTNFPKYNVDIKQNKILLLFFLSGFSFINEIRAIYKIVALCLYLFT